MAVLPIRITGEPVLHERAAEVTAFDDDLRTLVADMYETMDLAPGVGLAGRRSVSASGSSCTHGPMMTTSCTVASP